MRRLRNCSAELSWCTKVSFLNKFSSDLRYSGHTTSFRKTVLKRVVERYRTELSNHLEGRKRLYRSREERERIKDANRVCSQKDTWFRAGGATSVLTVPVTPNGQLAETVRKSLLKGRQPVGTKTKVVEDGGACARNFLTRSNQFPRTKCERTDCVLCVQRGGDEADTKCVRNNIGYEGMCSRCPTKFSYIGETSRTAYTRLKEHLSDYRAASAARLPALPTDDGSRTGCGKRKVNVKSWMWEHSRDIHGGVLGAEEGVSDYEFKVTGVFKKCLDRQIDEGLRIFDVEAEGGKILNSKNEWFTPKIVEQVYRQQ